MAQYTRMEFISEHKNFNLIPELYNAQCKSMEEYLNENYDIDWMPMLETAYLEYLDYFDYNSNHFGKHHLNTPLYIYVYLMYYY